jgi:hypothetical protein
MYARLVPSRTSRLVIGFLAILSLILALRLSDANPDPPARAKELVLFDGSQKPTAPEGRRGTRRGQRTQKRVQRQATALLREAMRLPQEIPVPSGIRMYEEEGERIVFSKLGYQKMYLQAWNECLYVVGNTNAPIEGDIMSETFMSFKNDWASGAGLVAGFQDCQQRMVSLAKIYNLDLIRNLARELHREIPAGIAWTRKDFTGTERSGDRLNVGKDGEKAPRKTAVKSGTAQ